MPTGSDEPGADLLLDEWREALAEALYTERTQWERHRELTEAQTRATEAQTRATILQLQADAAELRSSLTQYVEAIAAKLTNGADGAPGPAGQPGEKGDTGPPGENGENGDATLLPSELAGQVATAARLLHELPPIGERASSGRVLRIERDEHGALVPIYDEPEPVEL
jgi:hypothetical protein